MAKAFDGIVISDGQEGSVMGYFLRPSGSPYIINDIRKILIACIPVTDWISGLSESPEAAA